MSTDYFIRTHTRTGSHATEQMAAEKAAAGAPPIKKRILAMLERSPNGVTPDEFCEATGTLINTARRRFTDLWKEGRIRHHPDEATRVNADGNECVVWVLGEDPHRRPSRHELMKSEILRLRALLTANGIEPDQDDLFATNASDMP